MQNAQQEPTMCQAMWLQFEAGKNMIPTLESCWNKEKHTWHSQSAAFGKNLVIRIKINYTRLAFKIHYIAKKTKGNYS